MSTTLKNKPGSKWLIISTVAALLAGTGLAAAQVADNPPGSAFQDQGFRESNGLTPAHGARQAPRAAAPGGYNAFGSYAAASRSAPLRQQMTTHRNAVAQDPRDQRVSAPLYFRFATGHRG